MKKRGAQRIIEMVMMLAATRGMVCREKTKRFMRIPPNSIPKAAAGRFTAPVEREAGLCAQDWGVYGPGYKTGFLGILDMFHCNSSI